MTDSTDDNRIKLNPESSALGIELPSENCDFALQVKDTNGDVVLAVSSTPADTSAELLHAPSIDIDDHDDVTSLLRALVTAVNSQALEASLQEAA